MVKSKKERRAGCCICRSFCPVRLQLARFLEDSARFYGCQFVIATHSPFLLTLKGVRIYDLDRTPVSTCRWTEVENVRTFYDFFKSHARDF